MDLSAATAEPKAASSVLLTAAEHERKCEPLQLSTQVCDRSIDQAYRTARVTLPTGRLEVDLSAIHLWVDTPACDVTRGSIFERACND